MAGIEGGAARKIDLGADAPAPVETRLSPSNDNQRDEEEKPKKKAGGARRTSRSIKRVPFRRGGMLHQLAAYNRERDASPKRRKIVEKRRANERAHLPDAIIFTATVLGSGAAADVSLNDVIEANARSAEEARASALSLAEAERMAHEARTVDEETTFLAGDPQRSPLATLFTEGRSTIYVPNMYLQIPGVGLHEMVRVTRETVITIRPNDMIQGWWQARSESRIASGDAADEGLAAFPPMYAEALQEGRIWRSSLLEELRQTSGVTSYNSITEAVTDDFPWDELQVRQREYGYNFSDDAIATAERMSRLISPLMIESVFMTEIINGGDGRTNMAVLDLAYQTIGPEGVALTPASGDRERSHGGGQPTRYVLGERRPVTMMEAFLDESTWRQLRLPEGYAPYATLAEGADRERYAQKLSSNPGEARPHAQDRIIVLLLGMWNILHASESPQARAAFERIEAAAQNPETRVAALTRLAEFIGMAHNNPAAATQALSTWGARGANINVSLATYSQDQFVADYGIRMKLNFPPLYETHNDRLERERREAWPDRRF